MTVYFGFALADSMFDGKDAENGLQIFREKLSIEEVRELVQKGVVPCLNPSHAATIAAMREKFGIDVPIPEKPPKVELQLLDSIIIMGVRGLPRLTDRHEYTPEEIASATFSFAIYRLD